MMKKFLLAIVSVLMTVAVRAVPAHPQSVKVQQPDGTCVTIQLHGDEWLNFTTTADGYSVVRDSRGYYVYAELKDQQLMPTAQIAHDVLQRSAAETAFLADVRKYQTPVMKADVARMKEQVQQVQRRALASRRATDYNNFRGLVILVQFNDLEFSRDDYSQIAHDMLNQENYTGYESEVYTGSVCDYFSDNSKGKFKPQFDVVGPYTVNYSQYDPQQTSNARAIVNAAVDAADADVDFSQYDGDNDGKVDLVYFIIAGNGANYSGNDERLWWPHRSNIKNVTKDGVQLGDYASSVELCGWISKPQSVKIDGIGTICHEFSHVLGLPDFYDTDYEKSGGQSIHPDNWSVMAGGSYFNDGRTPVGYSLYERYSVGFADEPAVINEKNSFTLEPLHVNQKGYRIDSPVDNEFFLLENRQNDGSFKWDEYLPGHGMLAYRVDKTNLSVWNSNTINANPEHNYYEVLWAGGQEKANSGYDTYPGFANVTELNNRTTPANLLTHSGSKSVFGLSCICEDDHNILFNVTSGDGPVTPTNVTVSNITSTTADITWDGFASNYEVRYISADSEGSDPSWLKYDDGEHAGTIGSSSSSTRTWGVMYPGSQVTSCQLTKVSWYEIGSNFTSDITVNIYSGGDVAPRTLVHTFTVSPEMEDAFHEVTLASPVIVTPGENLWITLTATGTRIMSMCASSERNNQWYYSGGSWFNFPDRYSSFAGKGWMIRACIEGSDLDENSVEWKTVNTGSSSCNLTGLTPATMYALKVRGDFGSDGYSPWTKITGFTTIKLGDASGDGKVDINDALCILNYLMGNPPADFNEAAADVNGDGVVDIADAVQIVNMIIGK